MKITKRQLKRIIKEEKVKLLKEQGSPGDAIEDAERGLISIALSFIQEDVGRMEEEIWRFMGDIGYDDMYIQSALEQLMDRNNLR